MLVEGFANRIEQGFIKIIIIYLYLPGHKKREKNWAIQKKKGKKQEHSESKEAD